MNIYPLNLETLIRNRDYEGIKALVISKLPLIVGAVIIVVVGFIIADLFGKLFVKALRAKGTDPSVHNFLRTMLVFILKVLAVLTALSSVGINVNSIIAALGATGIAAGLGLQDSVKQFASGITILINKPFKSGDFIEIENVCGNVTEIKIMYTTMVTLDNKRILVPNSHITSNNLINYTAENKRRIDLVYSISYDTDIAKAKKVLQEVTRNYDLVLKNPAPVIAVIEHGSGSINLACYVWVYSKDYWDVLYYMQENVKLAFDKNSITIPYEQIDVHLSNDSGKN